jgi:hypothetical protein
VEVPISSKSVLMPLDAVSIVAVEEMGRKRGKEAHYPFTCYSHLQISSFCAGKSSLCVKINIFILKIFKFSFSMFLFYNNVFAYIILNK